MDQYSGDQTPSAILTLLRDFWTPALKVSANLAIPIWFETPMQALPSPSFRLPYLNSGATNLSTHPDVRAMRVDCTIYVL